MPDQPAPSAATLYAKLARITGAVSKVPKSGYNAFHKYKYVTESDLVEALSGLLAAENVALLVSWSMCTTRDPEAKGGPVTTLEGTATFCCGDTGATHAVGIVGTGQDKGDKGVYKAATGAVKYLLMKCFLVDTGDDPERDTAPAPKQPPARKPAPASDKQKAFLAKLVNSHVITDEERSKARAYLAGSPTASMVKALLDKTQKLIKERKAAEAAAQE